MIVHTGVEVGPGAVDGDLGEEAGVAEGTQRVVDGGERDRGAGVQRGFVQALGGHVTVAAVADQKLGQREALPRRPQTAGMQPGRAAAPHSRFSRSGSRRHPVSFVVAPAARG
jgi:hypothetical protein